MRFSSIFFVAAVLAMAATSLAQTKATSLATYETHNANWDWFNTTIDGRDTAHAYDGSYALKIRWTTTGGTGFAGARSNVLLTEVGAGLSTGFAVRVYTQRISGTGAPMAKMECTKEDGSGMGGSDTALTLDDWTLLTLPPASIVDNYKHVGLVFLENSSSGEFAFWIDDLRREGVVWDNFEPQAASSVTPSAANSRGEASLSTPTLVTSGPAPTAGSHLYGITWSGETDNQPEISHLYPGTIDLTHQDRLKVDVYVPSGTGLPEVAAWISNAGGANGSWHPGSTVAANNQWQTMSISLAGLPASATVPDAITNLNLVFPNAGNTGTLFVDNLRAENDVPTAVSILRADDPPTTNGSTVRFTVAFSEAVSGVTAGDFTLSTTGNLGGVGVSSVDPASGPSSTYTVTVNTGTGDGNVRLNLVDDDSISDGDAALGGAGSGNGDFYAGEYYAIHRSTPATPDGDLFEVYEKHNAWAAYGLGTINIVGFDGTHVTQGSQALHLTYATSSTYPFEGIESNLFQAEIGRRLSTGLSLDLYLEPQGGATGAPKAKLELLSAEGGLNDNTGEVQLVAGANTLNVMPTKNYERVFVVIVGGSASGTFDIWMDNLRRDTDVWDGFESTNNTNITPINIDGTYRGERTLGGVSLVNPGPIGTQGSHCYNLTWSGDGDGRVELRHDYPAGVNLATVATFRVDVFIPTSTGLPTVNLFITDGINGSSHTGAAITANNVWQTVEIALGDLGPLPIDETNVKELVLVFDGAGTTGQVFVDNLRTTAKVNDIADWLLYF